MSLKTDQPSPRRNDIAHHERAASYYSMSFDRETQDDHVAFFTAEIPKGASFFSHNGITVIYTKLLWDSDYFQCDVYRIEFVDYDPSQKTNRDDIADALSKFLQKLPDDILWYVSVETPSEDTLFLQALSIAGFCLIENRLTYYQKAPFHLIDERFPVRSATHSDINNLRGTAARSRNYFDRYHADPFYSEETADAYLSTYIENSVTGFADIVIVPDIDSDPPNAFLTGKWNLRNHNNGTQRFGQPILSAVSPQRRGWYFKLISELTHWFAENGADAIFMVTQSTNRAVTHIWERSHYKLGRSTHLWSAHNKRL